MNFALEIDTCLSSNGCLRTSKTVLLNSGNSSTEEIQGNQCVRVPLNCPSGTVERENVCVQFIPTLMATGFDLGSNALLIIGFLIFGIFTTGFVTQRIRRTS